jgi:UDP-glucose 4-epimerase
VRILLTGSSGWLGRFLAPRLRAAGHIVTGLDVAPGPDTTVVGSVADAPLIRQTFSEYEVEAVIHSAALHKPDISRYAAQAFVDVNVTGTLNLLEAAVAAGNDRFIFTSTTSLMISAAIRAGGAPEAAWLTEEMTPLEPRNIYGVTKLSAEHLGRIFHLEHGLPVTVLRTGRFFPEDDDTLAGDGLNLKANEFLHRRLTVEDAAEAHVVALQRAPELGFETFILSAPTPFARADCGELSIDAASMVERYSHPRRRSMPTTVGACRSASTGSIAPRRQSGCSGFDAVRISPPSWRRYVAAKSPIGHDPSYTSPKEAPTRLR